MGVKDVFDVVVDQSYQHALRRFEAAESRIQHLLTLAPTIVAAIALFARVVTEGPLEMDAVAFAAIGLVVAAVALGLGWLIVGSGLTFLDPANLENESYYGMGSEEFQRAIIHWSGKHLKQNRKVIWRKWLVANVMLTLLVASAIVGVAWAVPQG